jgi:hypothetical protein
MKEGGMTRRTAGRIGLSIMGAAVAWLAAGGGVAAQTIIYRHSIPGDAAAMVQGAGGASGGGASGSGAPSGGGSGSGGGSPLGGGAANQAPVAGYESLGGEYPLTLTANVLDLNCGSLGCLDYDSMAFPPPPAIRPAADYDPDGDPLTVVAVDGDPDLVGVPITHADGFIYRIDSDGTIFIDSNGAYEHLYGDGSSSLIWRPFSYTISDGSLTDTGWSRIEFVVN